MKDNTTPNWRLIDSIQGFYFWSYDDNVGTVYQATTECTPPADDSGCYSLSYLQREKGIIPGHTVASLLSGQKDIYAPIRAKLPENSILYYTLVMSGVDKQNKWKHGLQFYAVFTADSGVNGLHRITPVVDLVMEPGGTFMLDKAGRLVVYGFKDAQKAAAAAVDALSKRLYGQPGKFQVKSVMFDL